MAGRIRVSILVLMEGSFLRQVLNEKRCYHEDVSILVLMEGSFLLRPRGEASPLYLVSILVLMEGSFLRDRRMPCTPET